MEGMYRLRSLKKTLLKNLCGTEGLFAQKTLEITDDVLGTYKNQEFYVGMFYACEGGYDLLGRTADQIRTTEQVNAALASCKALRLDGLVIIGGVTSNTDAAQLAETFAEAKCSTKVMGVPVTLNGDLKNQFVEANVGFDTICKFSPQKGSLGATVKVIVVNSQLISNVCTDALSAEKVILGEEVAASKLTLFDITKQICDAVQARAEQDKNHGVILLPEGLIESIPEVYALLQLLLRPESDDSAQLSQIETEKLLAQLVENEMSKRLVLGHICYHILAAGLNGYMATVTNLKNPVNKWKCGAAPMTAMMTVKRFSRGPKATSIGKPAIHPATVDLKGRAYELLRQDAAKFLLDDVYRNPGPIQFDGPGSDAKAVSLCIEDQDYMGRIKLLQDYLDKVRSIVKPGCSQDVLKAALSAMASVTDILSVMSAPSSGAQGPI
ncbi:hypothetical protein ACLOJK_038825 [Asimina triloba]